MPLIFFSVALFGCSKGPTGRWEPRDFFTDPNVIALALASERGEVKEIDRLVSLGTDVNARGKDGITPLFLAMWAKNKAGFLRLLERGADPNLQLSGSPGAGSSIMSVSALVENDSDWLEIVLKHRGNPRPEKVAGTVDLVTLADLRRRRRPHAACRHDRRHG